MADKTTVKTSSFGKTNYYWGRPTSLINWCEKDHEVDPIIAEFFNTYSNLFFVFAGLSGLRLWMKYKLPFAYFVASAALVLTGIFSGAFHATLIWEMQKLDEIFENMAPSVHHVPET